jgi:O-antigen ligase
MEQPRLSSRIGQTVAMITLGLFGAALGVGLARLPLLWAAAGLYAAIAALLTLADPLLGLGLALIVGPTKPVTDAYAPGFPLDAGQIMLIAALGAWLLHCARRKRLTIPHTPLTAPLLAFIGAAGLSLLNALSLGYALKEMIKWGQMLIVMWVVIDLARGGEGRRGRWPLVIGAVLASGAAQALIGVWQFGLRGDGPEHFLILGDRFYRAYGTFEQPNPYAGFLGLVASVAIGLSLHALERWFGPVWAAITAQRPPDLRRAIPSLANRHIAALLGLGLLSGLLLAAIVMSWSRGAWLGIAAACGAILLAWPRKTRVGVLLVALTAVGGFLALRFNLLPAAVASRLTGFTDFVQTFDVRGMDINPANYAVLERLAHWQAAQEMARFHLWLGVGIGNYEPVYPAYALINWPYALGHAHNIYLNLLAEMGIIGLFAYGVLWISVLWQTWRVTRQASGWPRALALGMLGAWTHLTVHQMVDTLFVANLHLHLGSLLGVLSILIALQHERRERLEQCTFNPEHNHAERARQGAAAP